MIQYESTVSKTRLLMRPGESARVGCSPWVEFCVPDDKHLSEEHFQIDYLGSISIRPIGHSKIEVYSPGQNPQYKCESMTVLAGDCLFTLTTFGRETIFATQSTPTITTLDRAPNVPIWRDKESILEMAMLSEESLEIASTAEHPMDAIQMLDRAKRREDAVRLLASVLGPTERVRWCMDGLKFARIPVENTTQLQIQNWVAVPNESNRELIEQSIESAPPESPWLWCLKAIGWTGGSLAPKGFAVIPPPSRLSVSAVITAMQLANCHTDPDAFRSHVIQQGMALLPSNNEREEHATSR